MELDNIDDEENIIGDILFIEQNLPVWVENLCSKKFTKFDPSKEYTVDDLVKLNHQWQVEYELYRVDMIIDRLLEWYSQEQLSVQEDSGESTYSRKATFGNFIIEYIFCEIKVEGLEENIVFEEITLSYKSKFGHMKVLRPTDDNVLFIPGKWIDELKTHAQQMLIDKDALFKENEMILSPSEKFTVDISKINTDDTFWQEYHKRLYSDLLISIHV